MFLVQKAKETRNEQGLPLEWPVKANPCKEGDTCPRGWEKMTQADLEALKAENQQSYDEWKARKEGEQRKREEAEKASEQASAKSAQGKLQALQFTDEEIQKIMGTNYVG